MAFSISKKNLLKNKPFQIELIIAEIKTISVRFKLKHKKNSKIKVNSTEIIDPGIHSRGNGSFSISEQSTRFTSASLIFEGIEL